MNTIQNTARIKDRVLQSCNLTLVMVAVFFYITVTICAGIYCASHHKMDIYIIFVAALSAGLSSVLRTLAAKRAETRNSIQKRCVDLNKRIATLEQELADHLGAYTAADQTAISSNLAHARLLLEDLSYQFTTFSYDELMAVELLLNMAETDLDHAEKVLN